MGGTPAAATTRWTQLGNTTAPTDGAGMAVAEPATRRRKCPASNSVAERMN